MMHEVNRAMRSVISVNVIPKIQSPFGNLHVIQNDAGLDTSSCDQGLGSKPKVKGQRLILQRRTLVLSLILEETWT